MGQCNLDCGGEYSTIYVLLCDILYSIQRSNTSEAAGGQDNHSLHSDFKWSQASFSKIAICSISPSKLLQVRFI